MKPRDPSRFEEHLQLYWKKIKKAGAGLSKYLVPRAAPSATEGDEVVCESKNLLVAVAQPKRCSGILVLSALQVAPQPEDLVGAFATAWERLEATTQQRLADHALQVFHTFDIRAKDTRLIQLAQGGKRLKCKEDPCCDLSGPITTRQILEPYAQFLGLTFETCRRCLMVEEEFVVSMMSRIRKVMRAWILTQDVTVCNIGHLQYLTHIKSMNKSGNPYLDHDALVVLKAAARARENLLTFKRDEGAILGTEITKDHKEFLLMAKHCIMNNTGNIQNKILLSGFNAYLSMLIRREKIALAPERTPVYWGVPRLQCRRVPIRLEICCFVRQSSGWCRAAAAERAAAGRAGPLPEYKQCVGRLARGAR